MTPVFIVACVAVFAAMVVFGVPVLWPKGAELIGWGANEGVRIVLQHEYWRLFTSVFVHGGLIHLAVNMWSLFVIGPLVERLYGNWAFAVLYVAAGIGGAIASVAASPVRIGVGASGAICGLLGALLAFLITHRRSIPMSLLKSLRANVLGIIVFMAILGAIVPNIDQEAHLGGLATGFVGGLLLSRPLPAGSSPLGCRPPHRRRRPDRGRPGRSGVRCGASSRASLASLGTAAEHRGTDRPGRRRVQRNRGGHAAARWPSGGIAATRQSGKGTSTRSTS